MGIQRLCDSELNVMLLIWHAEGPVTAEWFRDRIEEKRVCKPEKLQSMLQHLLDAGVLKELRTGSGVVYAPGITQREYQKLERKNVLEAVFGRSVKAMISSQRSRGGSKEV